MSDSFALPGVQPPSATSGPMPAGTPDPQSFSNPGGGARGPAYLPSAITQPPTTALPTLPDYKADYAFGDFQRGFYVAAFQGASIRAARDPRDGAAMTLIAELYAQGLGMPQDIAKAKEWYRLAVAQNDANAAFALAMLLMRDSRTPGAQAEGLSLLEKAAAGGNPLAAYNLAVSLIGKRTAADLPRAVTLLRQASDNEVADAQYALAVLLREGRGTEPDKAEAARWMSRAAANGHIGAQTELAIMLFNGDGMPANEAQAARLFTVAAARGNAIAQNRLARILAAGRGLARDPVQAAAWHMLASAQGRDDSWLDSALKDLTPEEKQRAEVLARARSDDINFGIAP